MTMTNTKDPRELPQVAIRMVEMPPLISDETVDSPRAAARLISNLLKDYDREAVVVVNFNNRLKPINMNLVSLGSVNSSVADIREIMKSAILSNATNVMLFHNHPSGFLEPSKEDIQLTSRLQDSCKALGIPLLDHIIVAPPGERFFSFRENQVMQVPERKQEQSMDDFTWRGSRKQMTGTKAADPHQKYDPAKAKEDRKNEVKEIVSRLEQGVKDVFSSQNYKNFLNTMAKFPRYSVNNNLLIMMQKPDAQLCQSFTGWKEMGRYVKKGEKGIRILAPTPYKINAEQEKYDSNGKAILGADGMPEKETVQLQLMGFKAVSTFDISQTEGKELLQLGVDELTGSVDSFDRMFEALKEISPVPVTLAAVEGNAKGYFHTVDNCIVIQKDMSDVQTLKTLIHEIAHAKLHNKEAQGKLPEKQSRSSMEVEAESVAYTVCQHFGIDTSDYSFGYVAGWSEGKELPELKASLQTIRDNAAELIDQIRDKVQEITQRREMEKPSILDKLLEKKEEAAQAVKPAPEKKKGEIER